MISGKSVLGLIPARGGSKRVPGKNLREFNHPEFGKLPLLEIAIRVARQSKYIDRIIVSSDSDEILKFAKKINSETITRPLELATDSATSESVAIHALSLCPADLLVLLQPTSPLRTAADIDTCIEAASECGRCVSVNQATGQRNGAVYVTRQDCDYSSFPVARLMSEARSLDIDTEADFQ